MKDFDEKLVFCITDHYFVFSAFFHLGCQHPSKKVASIAQNAFVGWDHVLAFFKYKSDICESCVVKELSHVVLYCGLGNMDLNPKCKNIVKAHVTVISSEDKELSIEVVCGVTATGSRL